MKLAGIKVQLTLRRKWKAGTSYGPEQEVQGWRGARDEPAGICITKYVRLRYIPTTSSPSPGPSPCVRISYSFLANLTCVKVFGGYFWCWRPATVCLLYSRVTRGRYVGQSDSRQQQGSGPTTRTIYMSFSPLLRTRNLGIFSLNVHRISSSPWSAGTLITMKPPCSALRWAGFFFHAARCQFSSLLHITLMLHPHKI